MANSFKNRNLDFLLSKPRQDSLEQSMQFMVSLLLYTDQLVVLLQALTKIVLGHLSDHFHF